MKVLIIGASGLVGGSLLEAFLRGGAHEVTGTCHAKGVPGLLPLEIADAEAVSALLESVRPDVTILTAALTDVNYCETHPDEAHRTNIAGTANVVDACRRWGSRVVYTSTDYVFDGRAGPYCEDAEPNPISVYGKSKLEGERLVRALDDSVIVRTTVVLDYRPGDRNFMMRLIGRLARREPLAVPTDQYSTPTYAQNLADVIRELVETGKSGIFNVSCAECVNRYELARQAAAVLGLDAALIVPRTTAELGQTAPRPLRAGFVIDKVKAEVRTPILTLSQVLEAIRDKWAQHRATPQGAREDILNRVSAFYHLVHEGKEFVPGCSKVHYGGRVFDDREMRAVADAVLDFRLTFGPHGQRFEEQLALVAGRRYAIAVNSGSSANLVAIGALCSPEFSERLQPGDEVITPAMTFPTTLAPILQNRLVPVFVDVELGTYNVDPRALAAAVGGKTRAIFVPHTLGNPADMEAIMAVAARHGLIVIEDTCDALGARCAGRLVGTFGAISTYSFYAAHHVTMGEGGAVACDETNLARVVRSLRDWGRACWCQTGESNPLGACGRRFSWQFAHLPSGYDHKYVYTNIGYNLKPLDIQCAMGLVQLERLEAFAERRRANFERLYSALERYTDRLILPKATPGSEPSWFAFPLTVRPEARFTREDIVRCLEEHQVETRPLFAGNVLRHPAFQGVQSRVVGDLRNSDMVLERSFFIGVYPGLTDSQVDYMLEVIGRFMREH